MGAENERNHFTTLQKCSTFLFRAHLHMAQNLPANSRRSLDEYSTKNISSPAKNFPPSRDFKKIYKNRKSRPTSLKNLWKIEFRRNYSIKNNYSLSSVRRQILRHVQMGPYLKVILDFLVNILG